MFRGGELSFEGHLELLARVPELRQRNGRMTRRHHDLVLAVTSHIPHLIAYTIVGTASDLEGVTRGEVIKYSAGGFRDFTRIAASDPTMWRDVFLNNREAVLEMLDRFLTDLALMREAIRAGDGETMFDLFRRTRTSAPHSDATSTSETTHDTTPETSQTTTLRSPMSTLTVIGTLLSDILLAVVDPRIRLT